MVVACNKISISFGVKTILENVSFNINENEKVAIVGVNGAGKSTLFKIITNELTPDSGTIAYEKNKSLGYLSQLLNLDEELTIYDTLLEVFSNLIELEGQLEDVRLEIENQGTNISEDILHKYDELQQLYKELGGYEYKSHIRGIIIGLGFTEEDYYKKINTLSGGQKTRVSLGRLLLQKPRLLLLDEPTNHLDINSITWLEDYLKNYDGTVMLISHDRYFLDKVVNKIIEIENRTNKVYNGNFTDYSVQKEIDREIILKQYKDQQKEIKKQEEVIRVLKSYNREKSVKRARSREKLLSKMDVMDRPEPIPESMRLSLEPSVTSGYDVLKVENLSKSFGDFQLFSDINFNVYKGDKIALIGDNGIGKTTLFKILLKQIDWNHGEMVFGSNVNVGYYDQEHNDLNDENTLFEEISNNYPKLTNTQIRNNLAAFVFTGDDANKKISTLSGGEKGRIALLKIILSKANFLLLDEPTNHLDMFSKEILEDAISAYTGTVFYISHDRYFINSTADKIFHFTKSGVNIYDGNYDYFMEQSKKNATKEVELKENSQSKEDWLKQKEEQAEEKRREKKILKLEAELEEAENKIKDIDRQLEKVSVENDLEKLQSLFENKQLMELKINEILEQWEQLN